jgi:copper chaperone CopZ
METVRYTVPNISCGHCVQTIERVVGALPGVERVEGDVATKRVEVRYAPPATEEQIVAEMTEWEYPPAR